MTTSISDGDILKLTLKKGTDKNDCLIEKIPIKKMIGQDEFKDIHIHINGIRTSENKLKKFYLKMCEYARVEDTTTPGELSDIEDIKDVYFIFNEAGPWEGFIGKSHIYFTEKLALAEESPPAQTLSKLILADKVKYVTAHSNGNVKALFAFDIVCNVDGGKDRLKDVIYHGLSMQIDNDLLKVSSSTKIPFTGIPFIERDSIIKFLHSESTYYFNLGEERPLETEKEQPKLRKSFNDIGLKGEGFITNDLKINVMPDDMGERDWLKVTMNDGYIQSVKELLYRMQQTSLEDVLQSSLKDILQQAGFGDAIKGSKKAEELFEYKIKQLSDNITELLKEAKNNNTWLKYERRTLLQKVYSLFKKLEESMKIKLEESMTKLLEKHMQLISDLLNILYKLFVFWLNVLMKYDTSALSEFLDEGKKIYYINNFGILAEPSNWFNSWRIGDEGTLDEHRAELFCLRSWGTIHTELETTFKRHWRAVTTFLPGQNGKSMNTPDIAGLTNNRTVNSGAGLDSSRGLDAGKAINVNQSV